MEAAERAWLGLGFGLGFGFGLGLGLGLGLVARRAMSEMV